MAQAVHPRLLDKDALALVYSPAAQTADTGTHAAPSLASEYVVPNAQAAHTRSASSAPSTDIPCPSMHVDQVAHESVDVTLALAPALNCPLAQAVHTWSLDTVALALVYVPAAQTEDTAVQASPLSALE